MKRFFDLTFKPFFVLTGVGTAIAFLFAFWPQWATGMVVPIGPRTNYPGRCNEVAKAECVDTLTSWKP